MIRHSRWIAALGVAIAAPAVVSAQANLSTQGFGYPPGQLSSRALGTGGAVAEIDPLTPLNPATIALHANKIVTFQIEPEFRKLQANGTSERTSIARYPNVFIALPIGARWVIGAGSSTLLDRTATTIFETQQPIETGETVPMKTKFQVNGAMNDVRVAAAWTPAPWVHLGVGVHGIAGSNLVSVTQTFPDTTQFSSFNQSLVIGFSGIAGSAGVDLTGKRWTLGVSGMSSGPLHASIEDSTLTRANVPARFGATLAYTGIPNSAIAIRTSRIYWSSLNGLGTPGTTAVDAWDSGIGADISGPRFLGRTFFLRAGARDRTLPFQAEGHDVKEQSVSGGIGTNFANGRVLTDFAAIYAERSANIAASEHAWTFSIGLSVRP